MSACWQSQADANSCQPVTRVIKAQSKRQRVRIPRLAHPALQSHNALPRLQAMGEPEATITTASADGVDALLLANHQKRYGHATRCGCAQTAYHPARVALKNSTGCHSLRHQNNQVLLRAKASSASRLQTSVPSQCIASDRSSTSFAHAK